jgi:hypothetical protein
VAAAAAAGPDSVAAAVAAAAAPMRLQRAGEEAALAGEQDLMHNSALAAAWQDQGLAVGGRDPWPPSAGDTTAARAWQAPRQLTGTSSWQPPPACTAGGDQMLQLVQAEAGARAPFTWAAGSQPPSSQAQSRSTQQHAWSQDGGRQQTDGTQGSWQQVDGQHLPTAMQQQDVGGMGSHGAAEGGLAAASDGSMWRCSLQCASVGQLPVSMDEDLSWLY